MDKIHCSHILYLAISHGPGNRTSSGSWHTVARRLRDTLQSEREGGSSVTRLPAVTRLGAHQTNLRTEGLGCHRLLGHGTQFLSLFSSYAGAKTLVSVDDSLMTTGTNNGEHSW